MNYRFTRHMPSGIFRPLSISVSMHLLFAVIVVLLWKGEPEEEIPQKPVEQSFEISVVTEEEALDQGDSLAMVAEAGDAQDQEVAQQEEAVSDPPPEPEPPVKPETEPPPPSPIKEPPPAPSTIEEKPDDTVDQEALSEVAPLSDLIRNQADPEERAALFPQKTTQQAYDEIFSGQDQDVRDRQPAPKEPKKLLNNWKAREQAMRGSLESFSVRVAPGNHTGVGAPSESYQWYIERIHDFIHGRWAFQYLTTLSERYPMSHPLNRLSLNAVLEIVIDAKKGVVEEVNIVRTSGESMFDAEAVLVARSIGHHPRAPSQIVSPDGRIYLHWNFWRDSRQCNTGGVTIFLVNSE